MVGLDLGLSNRYTLDNVWRGMFCLRRVGGEPWLAQRHRDEKRMFELCGFSEVKSRQQGISNAPDGTVVSSGAFLFEPGELSGTEKNGVLSVFGGNLSVSKKTAK